MSKTIDFQEWLDGLDDDDIESIYYLYESIVNEDSYGQFEATRDGDKLTVSEQDRDEKLLLVSEDAKNAFLKKLDEEYGGEMGVQGEYEYFRSMQKED